MSSAVTLTLLLSVSAAARAPQEDPTDSQWQSGDRVASVEALARAVKEDPTDDQRRLKLVRREMILHRYAHALQHAAPLGAELDPERGYCLYRLGRYERALKFLDPTRPDQTLLVFDLLESLGHPDRARPALAQAARVLGSEHPEILVRRGRLLAGDGDHAAAEAACRQALEGDPILAEAWFILGRALARRGQADEARAALEHHRELLPLIDALDFARKSLDLAPNHGPNHASLGDVERRLGRLDRAELSYRRAAQLARDDELPSVALRHARLLIEDRTDLPGATALLDAAFARVADVRLLVRKGDLLLEAALFSRAEEAFAAAANLRPDDTQIRERLRATRAAKGAER